MGGGRSNQAGYGAILIVLVALIGVAALTAGGDDDSRPAAREVDVATVATRVERLRRLRFRTRPRPVTVTPRQAQREALRELDRDYPPARRRADEQVLTALGLLEPGTDLRDVSASVFGEEVAGYYDPRSGRLRVVRGGGTSTPVLAEMTLAHELVHALEDQRFSLRVESAGSDDAQLAYLALVEGTATAVMFEYAQRHFTAAEALSGLLPSAFGSSGGGLPPFILAQLLFPYESGRAFVEYLYRRAGRRWALVDLALRVRPPSTTEQVLHPEKYLAVEPALPVGPGDARAVLGPGWRRAHAGTLGEWGTGMVLDLAPGNGARAAGWGGDRYELWRGPDGTVALLARWRWDDADGRRAFARRLERYARERRAPGVARVARRPRGVIALAIAPDPALASRLAAGRSGP